MERLFTYLVIGAVALIALKVFVYWATKKTLIAIKSKRRYTAEQIIAANKPIQVRNKEIDDNYNLLIAYFKELLQDRKLGRNELLAIEDYLKKNVSCDKIHYNNNAHFIYHNLKHAADLKIEHINKLVDYLEEVEYQKNK